MTWYRCGACGSYFDGDQHDRCYGCGTPKGTLPVRPARTPYAEVILANDKRRSIVGSAVLAIIGAIGLWNIVLAAGGEAGLAIGIGVAFIVAIAIWVAHVGGKQPVTFNSAGQVALKVFSGIGIAVLSLIGVAISLVVLLFVVCATSGLIR